MRFPRLPSPPFPRGLRSALPRLCLPSTPRNPPFYTTRGRRRRCRHSTPSRCHQRRRRRRHHGHRRRLQHHPALGAAEDAAAATAAAAVAAGGPSRDWHGSSAPGAHGPAHRARHFPPAPSGPAPRSLRYPLISFRPFPRPPACGLVSGLVGVPSSAPHGVFPPESGGQSPTP